MPTKYTMTGCAMRIYGKCENKSDEQIVSADKLIDTFTDMANRGTLLCGKNITQEDLLMQIIGTIVKVSMDS